MGVNVTFDYQTFCRQRYGGVSRYIVEISKHLSDMPDISTTIFSPLHLNHYLRNYSGRKIGIFINAENKVGRAMRPVNDCLLKLSNRVRPADLIHQTYYSEFPAPKGSAVIVTVYDMTHELFPNMWSRADKTPFYKRRAVDRADHVICISESTKRDLMQICDVPESKITVTHLGFSKFPVPDRKVDHSGSLLDPNQPFLLFVGSRGGYKNFNRLVEAFASSKILRRDFRIVAFGGGAFSPRELSMFEKHGFRQNQIAAVSGDDAMLGEAYRNAVMLIYPSLYEGFGFPPIEAMSVGCPVAASDAGPMPEVAGGAAIHFDPHSVEAIRHSIEGIVTDTEARQTLIQKGLERARKFSWERCARETATVYRNVCGISASATSEAAIKRVAKPSPL